MACIINLSRDIIENVPFPGIERNIMKSCFPNSETKCFEERSLYFSRFHVKSIFVVTFYKKIVKVSGWLSTDILVNIHQGIFALLPWLFAE